LNIFLNCIAIPTIYFFLSVNVIVEVWTGFVNHYSYHPFIEQAFKFTVFRKLLFLRKTLFGQSANALRLRLRVHLVDTCVLRFLWYPSLSF